MHTQKLQIYQCWKGSYHGIDDAIWSKTSNKEQKHQNVVSDQHVDRFHYICKYNNHEDFLL